MNKFQIGDIVTICGINDCTFKITKFNKFNNKGYVQATCIQNGKEYSWHVELLMPNVVSLFEQFYDDEQFYNNHF